MVIWDDYVNGHSQGSFCHLFGWLNVIVKSCGHTPHYIIAESDSSVVGVLPLFEVKSFIFGHTLCSTPFCMYGGAIADTDDIKQTLEKFACDLAEKLQVDYLELRYQTKQTSVLIEKSQHGYFIKELPVTEDEILLSIKKKQRAVIRHSLKNGLSVTVNKDIDSLYEIYSTSVRNLGTPVFPKKLFSALVAEFGNNVDVLTVYKDDMPLSSVMSFYYKNTVMPYYGGGLSEARASKSNDHMYFQLMCHAVKKGCSIFDFGRSKNDSGAFSYKSTWGIDPSPLYHYYYLVKSRELPNLSPNNPKYKTFIRMWQKLPLPVSQFIGPFLSKYLG
ncbi:FemAB family XrtA/PEP-CTERM system-associated protein [Flavobacterium sp. W21_SRS_FM6]|uniref:FemAB family XrtA/PEP-CTERM system-associated protein n=1 Tax=Flavobacterium sp. W21_SRS_FM6 TaxID=3240268 RepID=UPI003F91FEB1